VARLWRRLVERCITRAFSNLSALAFVDGTEITDGKAQSITFDDAHDLLWAHNSPEAEEAVGC
jgi:hypothetical protein